MNEEWIIRLRFLVLGREFDLFYFKIRFKPNLCGQTLFAKQKDEIKVNSRSRFTPSDINIE